MPDSAGGRAAANDASASVTENPDDEARRLRRLQADVAMTRRVLDELLEGQGRADAKHADVVAIYKAKADEVKRMVADAKSAVKDAEAALADAEKGN
jgi:multidrug resistance efflux pump